MGTISLVWRVARKKIRENPGVRFHIAAYYKHLFGDGPVPVSRENVMRSIEILSKIQEELLQRIPVGERLGVSNNTNHAPVTNDKIGPNGREVFLTGASGLLGSALCDCLSNTGRTVRAQVRRSVSADMLRGASVERLYVDFNKGPIDYHALIDGAKEIIHCAHSTGAVTWEQFKAINVDTSLALYKAARTSGCRKFVYISSVAVYGVRNRNPRVVTEETPVTCGHSPYDFYVKSKTMAEQELIGLSKEGGPPLLIIRPGILYAADGKRLLRKAIPLRNGRLIVSFGTGKNHLPYTRVDAVAKTICAALDKNPFPAGIYQLAGDPNEGSREFLINRTGKLGISCHFLMLPALPLRLMALVMEITYLILKRRHPPKLTRYLIDSSIRDLRYNCSKAEKDLGWDCAEATSS